MCHRKNGRMRCAKWVENVSSKDDDTKIADAENSEARKRIGAEDENRGFIANERKG